MFSSECLNYPCFPQVTIYSQYLCYWEDSAGRAWGDSWRWHHLVCTAVSCWHGKEGKTLYYRWDKRACKMPFIENTCKDIIPYPLLTAWRNNVSKLLLQAWSWIFKLSTHSFLSWRFLCISFQVELKSFLKQTEERRDFYFLVFQVVEHELDVTWEASVWQ